MLRNTRLLNESHYLEQSSQHNVIGKLVGRASRIRERVCSCPCVDTSSLNTETRREASLLRGNNKKKSDSSTELERLFISPVELYHRMGDTLTPSMTEILQET